MSIYKQLVLDESARSRSQGVTEIPLMFSPKLGSVINAIRQGKYYIVGGRDSSGKRSFVDLNFLFGAYFWWANQPDPKPKLKILYFSMNKSLKMKLHKWLCTYMWVYHNRLIDINTLNQSQGKMYRLNKTNLQLIEDSKSFFDNLLEIQDVLEIFDGPTNPTGIYTEVLQSLKKVGGVRTENFTREFIYDPGYEKQITLVIVDSVHHMKNESKSGNHYDEAELHKKLNEYMIELRDVYKVSPVLIVPSFNVPGVYRLNQMRPDYREFRHYFEDSNVSLHLMNPFKLQMDSYQGYEMKDYISEQDKIARFRLLTVHRNTDGRDSIEIPLAFLPENGYFYDVPGLEDPALENMQKFIQNFKNEQISLFKTEP